MEGWEGLRERERHTHTPSILLKCSSAGVYAGTPRKAKHLQLLPSSSQDLQIFPLLAFLLSTFTSRVHQLQLCRSILAITTSYSHFSLLEPPPPTHPLTTEMSQFGSHGKDVPTDVFSNNLP